MSKMLTKAFDGENELWFKDGEDFFTVYDVPGGIDTRPYYSLSHWRGSCPMGREIFYSIDELADEMRKIAPLPRWRMRWNSRGEARF